MAYQFPIISPLQFEKQVDENGLVHHVAETNHGTYSIRHEGKHQWRLSYPDVPAVGDPYRPVAQKKKQAIGWATQDHFERTGNERVGF